MVNGGKSGYFGKLLEKEGYKRISQIRSQKRGGRASANIPGGRLCRSKALNHERKKGRGKTPTRKGIREWRRERKSHQCEEAIRVESDRSQKEKGELRRRFHHRRKFETRNDKLAAGERGLKG